MKRNDRYTSLIWAILGFYVAFKGYQLELGTLRNPGSGFLVFCAGITLSILSLSLLVLTFSSKEEEEEKILWKGLQWPKGMKLVMSLFFYVLVFRWMGFLLSTFLLLLFLFKGLEPQKWRTAISLSIISIAVCYLIFVVWLQSQFPWGIIERLIDRLY